MFNQETIQKLYELLEDDNVYNVLKKFSKLSKFILLAETSGLEVKNKHENDDIYHLNSDQINLLRHCVNVEYGNCEDNNFIFTELMEEVDILEVNTIRDINASKITKILMRITSVILSEDCIFNHFAFKVQKLCVLLLGISDFCDSLIYTSTLEDVIDLFHNIIIKIETWSDVYKKQIVMSSSFKNIEVENIKVLNLNQQIKKEHIMFFNNVIYPELKSLQEYSLENTNIFFELCSVIQKIKSLGS